MRSLAGTSDLPLSIDLDAETGSVVSSVSRDDLQKAASSGQPAEQAQSPLEVAVSLGEVALYVSGRPCETWWPPEASILASHRIITASPLANCLSPKDLLIHTTRLTSSSVIVLDQSLQASAHPCGECCKGLLKHGNMLKLAFLLCTRLTAELRTHPP